MSLVGWLRLAHPAQQRKLFSVLIVELCIVGVGFFTNFLKFNPIEVQQAILHDRMISPNSTARESEFRASDFSRSEFAMTRFEEGSFHDSSFERSDFSDFDLKNCRFAHSQFAGASFEDAHFGAADFRGADLHSIIVDSRTQLPLQLLRQH
jgi:uncharacterized protein YjbI with pentapeptide repeats